MRLTTAVVRLGFVTLSASTLAACAGSTHAAPPVESPVVALEAATEPAPSARGAAPLPVPTDAELAAKVDRQGLERAAIARSPALSAGAHRVRAMVELGKSEGALPDPEVMAQVWQVPLARPYALGDAQMIMLGVSQSFPAPGALGAKEEARAHDARGEAAMVLSEARDLVRMVDHALVDYVEARAKRTVHQDHHRVIARMIELARARYAGGGQLTDLTQAEVEIARLHADLTTEGSAIETAKAKLNGLLAREPDAPLGAPVDEEPTSVHVALREIAARARAARPEIKAADEKREGAEATVRAAERESKVPSFSVAALYFAPVGAMPTNAWGTTVTMSLPWLSGARSHGAEAARETAAAERGKAEDLRVRAAADAVTFAAATRGAEGRYAMLVDQALPASRRALDAAEAGYVSGRSELMAMLVAARSVVDVRMDIVEARAVLDHALVDLDWAAGARLPREPISLPEGADHVR